MAVISVVSSCKETALQLGTVLRDRGHVVEPFSGSQFGAAREAIQPKDAEKIGLFVVDLDCDSVEAWEQIKALAEEPSTALVPVVAAASAETEQEIARACAYGAIGLLRKPFRTVETVPDTERALAGAHPAR